jgi:hypothetical protein
MDYISVIRDSIETSISMKIFNNKEDALLKHIYKSNLVKIPLSKFKNIDNFNPNRLQKTAIKAYPLNDRPRGNNDINSVKYYQKQIQTKNEITPIWLLLIKKKYILLDGAHRIVASYIEGKKYINAYVIIL